MAENTSVGSIEGKLKLDDSDWRATIDAAISKARELGRTDPKVKIDTNAVETVAKLDAVAAAEGRVDNANKTSTVSANRNADAQRGQFSAMQALIAASPALVAGSATIAAGAVGLTGAFTLMGAAGMIAIKGIQDQMAAGTATGNTYATGLASLKGNFDTLATTGANAMLAGFNNVVGMINQDMPFLNQTVGEFAGLLGNVAGTALQGVLAGMQALNPLLQAGGAELSKFVGWLSGFATTNGFTSFVDYAIANLPSVMTLIENLVTTAGNIIAAFAPLGPTVIGILNGITGALNALPLPVLAGLVTMATTIAPAFNLAKTAVAVFGETAALSALQVEVFGTAINLAVPVVGILLAAISGIGMAMASAAAGTQQNTAATQSYTQELIQANGAIDDNIRKTAAKALQDDGAAQAAQTLGINMQDLVPAVLGNADAHDRLEQKINAAKDAYNNSAVVVDNYGNVTHIVSDEVQRNYDAAVKLQQGLDQQSGSYQTATSQASQYKTMMEQTNTALSAQDQMVPLLAAAHGVSVAQYQAATTAQSQAADQIAVTTLNMQLQGDAVGLLGQAFDTINGKSLSLAKADTNLAASVNQTIKSFDRNGLAINGSSEAAVANQQAIENQVVAAQAQATAVGKATGSTDKATQAYYGNKTALEAQLRAHNQLTPAIQAVIDKLYDVNNFKPKPVDLKVNNGQAIAAIMSVQDQLAAIHDKTVTITSINNSVDSGGPSAGTQGGAHRNAYATGGLIGTRLAGGGWSDGTGGGMVFGPGTETSDSIPVMASRNEFMVKASSVKTIGPANLEYMNRTGRLPQQGGAVVVNPTVHVTVQNPFTGEEVAAVVRNVSVQAANNVVNQWVGDQNRRRAS